MRTALGSKGLKKSFGGVRAVDGVSLSFEPAMITGLIGPNGSGKTTYLGLLTGMHVPDGGTVIAGGVSADRMARHDLRAYGVSRTFQEVRLFEQMSVRDNLLIALSERNVFGTLRERHAELHAKRADEILAKVGLSAKRDALASGLSYGQRKLLEIGRVIALDAAAVLFDEPYAGLFPEMKEMAAALMEEMRDQGKTVVLIEHDMGLIRRLCDRLVVMDEGKVLADGAPDEVLSDRAVIDAYLGN